MDFDLPRYKARWWPLYLEPIPGSGEQLTIAVAAVGDDGDSQIRQVLPRSALAMLFGPHSTGIFAVVTQTLTDVQSQLENGVRVPDIAMPFDGLDFGAEREAWADNINAVFDQAVRLTSSLGATAFGETRSLDSEVERVFAEWATKVRENVVAKRTAWNDRFEHNIRVGGRRPTRINFIHDDYAANFGVIRPKKPADIRALKIKLFDLERLRRHQPLIVKRVEVLVGIPKQNTPGLTGRDYSLLKDSFDFIYHEGIARDVPVHRFESAREVAKHLLKAA